MVAPMTQTTKKGAKAPQPSAESFPDKRAEMDALMEGYDAELASTKADLTPPEQDPLGDVDEAVYFMSPGEGIISESGFFKFNKEGMPYSVHQFAAWPVEVIEAVGHDGSVSTYVRMRFDTIQGKTSELVIANGEMGGFGRKDHPMTRAGWKAPSGKRAGAVEDVLIAAMKRLPKLGKLPTRVGYETAGWVSPQLHLRPGAELYVGNAPGSTVVSGDRMVWAKTMTELMDDSGILALGVAAVLGSLFRGILPLSHPTSHILNLTGAPSRGKTTILRALSSIAGIPNKPGFVDGASTARGLENRLTGSNHGWLLIDELDQLLMKDPDGGATTLMFISNGGGREKSSQSGHSVIGGTWESTLVTTGNKSLLDLAAGAKKGEALATRIFELDILDADIGTFTELSALPARIHALEQNHGHGYPAAVEAIATRRQEWLERFADYDAELRGNERLAPIFGDQARLLQFFQLALMGAELAGVVISPQAGARAQDAVATAMARYEQEPEQGLTQSLNNQHKLLVDLHQWLALNAGRFMWKGYAFKEPATVHRDTMGDAFAGVPSAGDRQIEQARYLSHSALGGGRGALGQIEQKKLMAHETDFEGVLVLGAAALEELERFARIDRAELTTAAKTFGLLQTNEKDRDGYKLGSALSRQLGGGSRGLKLLLRKPDLTELLARGRAATTRPAYLTLADGSVPRSGAFAGTGAWRPDSLASDDLQHTSDLWEQQGAPQPQEDDDGPLYIPGFDDEPATREDVISREEVSRIFGWEKKQ